MENSYQCAYVEIIEILKRVPREMVNKIPKERIKFWKAKKDKEYVFEYDESKSLREQNIMRETEIIYANIFKEYWATEEDKAKILQKEQLELQKIEDLKCSGEELFKNKEQVEETNENNVQEVGITVVEKKWYDKFFSFFKRIFKK